MPYGYNSRHDIDRAIRSVLVTERLTQNERTRIGQGGASAPASAYIAQSSTGGVAASTGVGEATAATVKFFSISTGSTLTELSTGETVYNFLPEKIGAGKYFMALREYGSHNYVALPGFGFDRLTGQLVGAMGTGDTTWTVDNIVIGKGADPRSNPASSTEALTVYNVHEWAGDDNALARIEWMEGSQRWEIYQVNCPE